MITGGVMLIYELSTDATFSAFVNFYPIAVRKMRRSESHSKLQTANEYDCIEEWDDDQKINYTESEIESYLEEDYGNYDPPRTSLQSRFQKDDAAEKEFDTFTMNLNSEFSDSDSTVTDYSAASIGLTNFTPMEKSYFRKLRDCRKQVQKTVRGYKTSLENNVLIYFLISVALCTVLSVSANIYLKSITLNNFIAVFYIAAAFYIAYSSVNTIAFRRAAEVIMEKGRVCRPILEMFVRSIIISYTLRILCETIINRKARFVLFPIVAHPNYLFFFLWVMFPFLFGIIFSINPQKISYVQVFQYVALLILFVDRLLYNPFVSECAARVYDLVIHEPMLLLLRHTTFFLDEKFVSVYLTRYIIQFIAIAVASCLTTYLGLYVRFGVSRNKCILIGGNLTVAIIQMISIFISPILGIVVSTPVFSEMNYSQGVSIMAAHLLSPAIGLNPSIFYDFPKREILILIAITVPASQVFCGLICPTGTRDTQLVLRDTTPIFLLDAPWKGLRSGINFFPKVITYLCSNYVFISIAITVIDAWLSYIIYHLSVLVPTYTFRDALTLLLYPILRFSGISSDSVAKVSLIILL